MLFIYVYFRDNVVWDTEQENAAKEKVEQNSNVVFSDEEIQVLEQNADKYWDDFYDVHQNRYSNIS